MTFACAFTLLPGVLLYHFDVGHASTFWSVWCSIPAITQSSSSATSAFIKWSCYSFTAPYCKYTGLAIHSFYFFYIFSRFSILFIFLFLLLISSERTKTTTRAKKRTSKDQDQTKTKSLRAPPLWGEKNQGPSTARQEWTDNHQDPWEEKGKTRS